MIQSVQSNSAEIIRKFLISPRSRAHFNDFFRFCAVETKQYLRLLHASGWRLPHNQYQAEQPLTDIVYDILGDFLASKQNGPYYVVFDYCRRHGITDFKAISDVELVRHFSILIRGFVRKWVTAAKDDADPQVALLKRRIADALNSPPYGLRQYPGDRHKYIYLHRNEQQLRENQAPMTDALLRVLVQDAFLSTTRRTDWCARIFELLDRETEFRNTVSLPALISTMIAVNAEYVDALSYVHDRPTGPLGEYRLRKICDAVAEASNRIIQVGVAGYLKKGRLTSDEAAATVQAGRDWLEDLCLSGEADSIPSYFLHYKPEIDQQEYQSRYKYVIDTVCRQALEEVRRILREDSTIWPFGDYSTGE